MSPNFTRRTWFAGSLAALGSNALFRAEKSFGQQVPSVDKPNILWITTEDIGPQLGCYGDTFAKTPVLDALAAKGVRYTHAWSNAPVCAPARTTIISGMYPTSTGSENMRSMVSLPAAARMYPCYLRDAGYYCTNNSKEDYNLEHTGKVWDDSSTKAHWRNRKPGQPFFAIFNNLGTHESQIRKSPHTLVGDPAKVRVPAYQPDTPEVRHDWTQYYDNIQAMDTHSGTILKQLEEDGLADSTIVFFYGDHGAGMPRSKRWPYNSGLQVPLIVYVPPRFRHLAPAGYAPGKALDRLVSFVDLGPTLLSIANVSIPPTMQGRAFMGPRTAPAPPYNFGFRGRMDERIDMVRSCTDGRFVYLRQFMPHKIYGQYIAYMFEMPTTAVWKKMYDAGKLKPPKTYFWESKPSEELYDLSNDRDEVVNLASRPEHRERLVAMRKAVHNWMLSIRDAGLVPECEMLARAKASGKTPYEVAHDDSFPLARILDTAERASMRSASDTQELVNRCADPDSAVRYWAVLGLEMRGADAVRKHAVALRAMLGDKAAAPRIAAAEALGMYGSDDDVLKAIDVCVDLAPADKNGAAVSILALNALDSMGTRAKPALSRIRDIATTDPNGPERLNEYPPQLVKAITQRLGHA